MIYIPINSKVLVHHNVLCGWCSKKLLDLCEHVQPIEDMQ